VQNIGGIAQTSVDFSPGVTLLVGRNATNRTSFLQAVMAALGSDAVSIKGDADKASVELSLGDETYTRRLYRRSDGVVTEGDPYLDDAELANLFAFLLESNEARRAVATGGDLRELIMRPVDTEAIQSEIDRRVQERESLKRELEEIEAHKAELPELEEQRTQLENEIEEKKAELEAKEEQLEQVDADVEETRQEKSEFEEELETLRSKRADLDDVRYNLETERESLEALREECNELRHERDDLPEPPDSEADEIEDEIRRLREHKQALQSDLSELQSVTEFNQEMLDEESAGLSGVTDESPDEVTSQLLPNAEVTCWTCGSEVEREQIESTLDQLRELRQTKQEAVSDLGDSLEQLNAEKRELQETREQREQIETRLDELANEIRQREDAIEDLQAQRDELTDDIEQIEAEVEERKTAEYGRVLDLHKEANQLEYELGKRESELESVTEEISAVEERIAEQDDVEAQLRELKAEIKTLRTKIDRIEADAVGKFNEHMDTVLELLDYANLDRIWIERREREVREGRRKVSKSVFELHVVRTAESGATYEDTVDHLSESEREVTGLVFALAGYLAHELYEAVPFMLLDSLEAIDSDRIATLVDYLAEYTGYLLVALLPEDASTLPDEYERLTEI
jgi:chromosome segregation ATPase